MSALISSLAEVSPDAVLDDGVRVGPFCTIGAGASIGAGTELISHVAIMGDTKTGRDNRFFPGAVIGGEAQGFEYRGESSRVEIGDANIVRESVTISRGTINGRGLTRVGNACYLMAGCHVAHDCHLGNRVVLANNVLLGGDVHVDDDAFVGGGVAVQQFTTIGAMSFVSGMSKVVQDVAPYVLVDGDPARPRQVNQAALKRNGYDKAVIRALTDAFKLVYRAGASVDDTREVLRSNGRLLPPVNQFLTFLQQQYEGRYGRGRDGRSAA